MSQSPITEYSIPYSKNRTAILALETPVSRKDIQFINKWLELLSETIEEQQEEEEEQTN